MFISYAALSFYNQVLMNGRGGQAFELMIFTTLISLAGAWIMWTAAGRAQLRYFLTRADIAASERDYFRGLNYYRKARAILKSSHFPPDPARPEALLFLTNYAEFLSAAGENDREALEVYHAYLEHNPADKAFAGSVIPLVMTSEEIDAAQLRLLARLTMLAPDNTDFADFTAAQYLNLEIYNAEAQEILLQAVRRGSALKERSLKFLLPRMLEADRRDPRALEVYLEAYRAGVEHRELKSTLGRIAENARRVEEPGPLTKLVVSVFEALKPEEREEISAAIRLGKPVETEAPPETELIPEPELQSETEAESEYEYSAADFAPYRARLDFVGKLFKGIQNFIAAVIELIWSGCCALVELLAKQWGLVRWVIVGGVALGAVIGLAGIIGHLGGPPASEEISLKVVSEQPFTIQVAAFRERERAERVIQELARAGENAYLVSTAGESSIWHQVRLGHFDTSAEAKTAAENLVKRKIITGYFIANFQAGTYIE